VRVETADFPSSTAGIFTRFAISVESSANRETRLRASRTILLRVEWYSTVTAIGTFENVSLSRLRLEEFGAPACAAAKRL